MPTPAAARPASVSGAIGTLFCRFLVPIWILIGATFKLVEASPKLLPKHTILELASRAGIESEQLGILLSTLISIELLAVALMLLVARLARPVAIMMLSVFCAVLIGEILQGGTDCGCLGSKSPSPLVMLIIDGVLLIGAIFFRPAPGRGKQTWPLVAALALGVVAAGGTFWRVMNQGPPPTPTPTPTPNGTTTPPAPNGTSPTPAATTTTHTPLPLEPYWYVGSSELQNWVGKRWSTLKPFTFMTELPEGLDEGTRYVVFFSRTCEHCQDMFSLDLAPNPELARRVTAIEIPAGTKTLRSPDAWEMPDTEATILMLPLGTDWIITPPLAVRIEDGIIRCAIEGDHKECFDLPPDDQ